MGPVDCNLTRTSCKSFKNFHFKGFSYYTKYLLQNRCHKYSIQLISSANPLKYDDLCHLNGGSFKKPWTTNSCQRWGNRSVCGLSERQLGGVNVRELDFMSHCWFDLMTHYQLLNFVNLWVSEQSNNNKKDSTSQECSCFIVLIILAVS